VFKSETITIFLVGVICFLFLVMGIKLKNDHKLPTVYGSHQANSIRVIAGDEFDIGLVGNEGRFHGKLRVKTPPDTAKHVIRFLNQAKQPKILFLEKTPDFWYIDIQVTYEGAETTLTKWLDANHLVWSGLPTSGS
jgi:hypothetical protein